MTTPRHEADSMMLSSMIKGKMWIGKGAKTFFKEVYNLLDLYTCNTPSMWFEYTCNMIPIQVQYAVNKTRMLFGKHFSIHLQCCLFQTAWPNSTACCLVQPKPDIRYLHVISLVGNNVIFLQIGHLNLKSVLLSSLTALRFTDFIMRISMDKNEENEKVSS